MPDINEREKARSFATTYLMLTEERRDTLSLIALGMQLQKELQEKGERHEDAKSS